jgi:AraC-like DNA-binding protein
MREPYITVRAVQPLVAALDARGHGGRDLLVASGIDPALLRDVDGTLPQRAVMRFWQCAAEHTRDEAIGLHLAEAAPLDSFEVHCYALKGSASLRDAFERACRYQRLIHETTRLELLELDGQAVLQHALPDGQAVPRQPAEFLAALWVRFGRLIAGAGWSPQWVRFAHAAPPSLEEHERVFGCRPRFAAGATAIGIDPQSLDRPNQQAAPALVSMLDRYAQDAIERMPAHDNLSARLREWLSTQLVGAEAGAEGAARAMHVSVRSLHRLLREEGTSYRDLLDRLRRDRATALLSHPRYSVGEVAFLLGFAELSSFYRAFKRWTGQTPVDFRRAARATEPNSR